METGPHHEVPKTARQSDKANDLTSPYARVEYLSSRSYTTLLLE